MELIMNFYSTPSEFINIARLLATVGIIVYLYYKWGEYVTIPTIHKENNKDL